MESECSRTRLEFKDGRDICIESNVCECSRTRLEFKVEFGIVVSY